MVKSQANMGEMFILLCEEIREEAKGVKTIIGVFPPGGIRGKIPILLPKFGIFASSPFHDDIRNGKITLKIISPSGQTVIEVNEMKVSTKELGARVQLSITMSPVVFNEYGEYVVQLSGASGFGSKTILSVQPLPEN